jgi:hypothetical protein
VHQRLERVDATQTDAELAVTLLAELIDGAPEPIGDLLPPTQFELIRGRLTDLCGVPQRPSGD